MKSKSKTESNTKRPHRARLSSFAKTLLDEWLRLELPAAEQLIVVAVSGGADSTALLLALHELNQSEKLASKLIVAHLDHGLRENSRSDAQWVAALAKELGYDIVLSKAKLKRSNKFKTREPRTSSPQGALRISV